MNIKSLKRANSTRTSATSPKMKLKSPMVRAMKGLSENKKDDGAASWCSRYMKNGEFP
jgi:hypothetical protein